MIGWYRFVSLLVVVAISVSISDRSQILFGAELPPAPEGSFSIVVIPDTQHYRAIRGQDDAWENPVFDSYTGWTAENLGRQRIAFVTHVGDIVDVNTASQWTVARRCMDRLHGRVPYGISVGNHDMVRSGNSSLFQNHFPQSRFEKFDWYGGSFAGALNNPDLSGNNANSYQLFAAEGLQFIVLHLECNAPDNVLEWASDVLQQHSDRRALITTHMGLGPKDKPKNPRDYFDASKGRMTWTKCHGDRGNSPQQMWEKCFRRQANVFMICCGDQSRTQALRQVSRGDHGNAVHELLSDYGQNGMRVMKFVPSADQIEVRTWNAVTNELTQATKIVPETNQHQFTLAYSMKDAPAGGL